MPYTQVDFTQFPQTLSLYNFNYYFGPGWGGYCNKSVNNYNTLLRNSKNWKCHLFAHVISSPPCILGCVNEKLSIQKCFITEFVTVLPYLKFSWKKYFVLLAALMLSKTEYLGFALCMYFLVRNIMKSKLQIYSCELVVSRFVLCESREEVLWNRDSSRDLKYSFTFNNVATTDCHTVA